VSLVLELRRVMPAPRSEVFGAFVHQLPEWWGPAGFTIPSADFDPQPAQRYRIEMQPPDGDAFFLTGEFSEVEPPSRLAFTFAWEPPDPDDVETLVELTFADSEVKLRQGEFKTAERLELHRGGWSDSFDKLARLLDPLDPD
jgi:uncharacterized protein YndB with AHSA1/START domain